MPEKGYRSSSNSARTSISSYRHTSTAPSHGDALMERAVKVNSSHLLASSSKLKAPTKNDAEKMLLRSLTSNASTGGNGVRRPYGRFIASRGGLALSVWERQAPSNNSAALRASRRTASRNVNVPSSSPPYFPKVKQRLGTGTPGKSPGRNVSRYNVRRKAYTSRNMDTSSKSVESKYSFQGTDTINYSNSTIVDVPLFSRPRPEGLKSLTASEHSSASALGARGGSRTFAHRLQLPAATFLTHIPTLPRAVRVDCGQSCAKEFLTRSPLGSGRHHHHPAVAPWQSAPSGEASSATTAATANLSSKSLESLSRANLPEVLSGALSLNINQLNSRHYVASHAVGAGNGASSMKNLHLSLMSTL